MERNRRRRQPRARSRSGRKRDGQTDEVVLRLAYRPPYDWTHLQRFLAARAIPGIEVADDGSYARTVATPEGGWAIVHVRPLDGEDALRFRVTCADASALLHLSAVARRVFDLAADPSTITCAFADDAILARLVERRPGLRIPGVWDPFECALRAIVGQQVSFAAGLTLIRRVVERAGRPIATPVGGLDRLFPRAAEVLAADLRGLGLTGSRFAAIKALATAVVDGTLDFSASADEIAGKLTRIPGIGPWTAQYVALRALGEPDAFLASDLVIRRMASEGGPTMTASALEKRSHLWRPWRAYAAIHLWAAAMEKKGNTVRLDFR